MFYCKISPGVAITASQFSEQGLKHDTSIEYCERFASIFSGRRRRVQFVCRALPNPSKIHLAKDTFPQSG